MLYRGDQNVSVTVVQKSGRDSDDRYRGGGWDRGRGGWGPGWGHHPRPGWHGPNVGGIIGGIVIGNAVSNWLFPPKPEVVVVQPQPVQVQNVVIQPWTVEWYNYCNAKYKSFDAKTGYYLGYDGQQHFCQ